MKTPVALTVEEYIAGFSPDIQKILREVRSTIRQAAPESEETIKYGIPTYMLNGNMVYFAAYKKHIGFFGVPTGNDKFNHDFKEYKTGRGSIQFPLGKPMPLSLIEKIVKFRVQENLKKGLAKT
jgi:uncharacterized protein YdhG (YjbR/CyaY superfamily)